MILPLRAGLVVSFLLYCNIYSTFAAPIPHKSPLPVASQRDSTDRSPSHTFHPYSISGETQRQAVVSDAAILPSLAERHAREGGYWDDPPVLVRRKKSKEPAAPKAATPAKSTPAQSTKQQTPPKVHKSLGERMHELHEKVKAVGQKIKAGFQKAGQKIKEGFQKFGHFLKTTGAKIAKVGLKIWSTVTKIASKVVGWIPVIGKPLGRIMDAGAEVANKISDKIKVHIGGKLGTAMDRMSKAQKIMSYIP